MPEIEGVLIASWDGSIYFPAEDSLLLLSTIPERCGTLLDVGTGSGIIAIAAAKRGHRVVATDIDRGALMHARRNALYNGADIQFVQCDLMSPLKAQFDTIMFNPPYLPGDEDVRYSGGLMGYELTHRFLEQARYRIKRNGRVLLVTSSISWNEGGLHGWKFRVLRERKLTFETLTVLECVPAPSLSQKEEADLPSFHQASP